MITFKLIKILCFHHTFLYLADNIYFSQYLPIFWAKYRYITDFQVADTDADMCDNDIKFVDINILVSILILAKYIGKSI